MCIQHTGWPGLLLIVGKYRKIEWGEGKLSDSWDEYDSANSSISFFFSTGS
jgi:hypothetical protein